MVESEDQKALLRKITIRKIFQSTKEDSFKEPIFHLFVSLLDFKDALETVLEEIQKQRSIKFLSSILDVLYGRYSKSSDFDEESQKMLIKAVFSCVDVNLPNTYTKCETIAFQFLQKAATLCGIFPKIAVSEFQKQQSNTNMLALYLLILSDSEENDPELLKTIIQPKIGQNFISYSTYIYLSTHNPEVSSPSVKSIITAFKYITDEELFSILATPMLRSLISRIDSTTVKDLPSLLSYIPRRLRKDVNGALTFYELLNKSYEFNDAVQIIKPFLEDILSIYLMTLPTTELTDGMDCDDLTTIAKKEVCDAFMSICKKFEFNPFESYFASKSDAHPFEVLLMISFVIRKTSLDEINEQWLDIATPIVPTNKKTANMAVMVHIAYFFAVHFDSKKGLKFLVQALDCNSSTAAKFLLSDDISFDFAFEEIATLFKPDSSPPLYLQTLITFLKHNFANTPELLQSEKSDIPDSDSNFELLPRFSDSDAQESNQEFESMPTTKTILFCSVLTALENNQPLAELLPLVASTISPAFTEKLVEDFPKPTQQRFRLTALSAYGKALEVLDKTTINALALTFLMMRPDQSMQYLGMTLQRLPKKVADQCMKKTLPFAAEYPDISSRMVALVSHAHPLVALNFLSTLINDSQNRRRVFLFFRSSETDDKTLITVFKSIGFCASFIQRKSFSKDFLSFATSFLNKHLSGTSLSERVNEAAFFAIKKLSTQLALYQVEHKDHVFPFKDFLMQYTCSYYLDMGDTIISANEQPQNVHMVPIILNALSQLIKIRPLRVSEIELRAIELTAVILQVIPVDSFPMILNAVQTFFTSAVDSSPNLSVFISITKPVFPALLVHSEWRQIAKLLDVICGKWESISLTESSEQLSKATNSLGILISYALPLLVSDVGNTAANIVCALHSLGCSIRNQMLSLPRSIRPSLGDLTNLDPQGLCEAVCLIVAKPLLTPQVYEVILSLIDLFNNNKVLEMHHLGIALAVEQLLKLRGSEEFRFDSQIVKGLCKAIEGKPQDIQEVVLRIFSQLFQNRLLSVLSCLIEVENMPEDFLKNIIDVICKLENGSDQLLDEIIRCLSSDTPTSSSLVFTEHTLPLLKETIASSSDEKFAKLIISIFRRPPESREPLEKAVIGDDVKEFAEQAAKNHKEALRQIANENLELGLNNALHFASCDDEACHLFLKPVIQNLITSATKEHFAVLETIFEKRSPESFDEFLPQIVEVLIPKLTEEECFSCSVALLKHCTEKQNEVFWNDFSKLEKSKPQEMIPIATKLFNNAKASLTAIVPLLPYAAINEEKEYIEAVAAFLGVKEQETLQKTTTDVLLAKELIPFRENILTNFVDFVKEDKNVIESLNFILVLCNDLNNENEFAIEAVVENLPIVLNKEYEDIIDAIIRLLSD